MRTRTTIVAIVLALLVSGAASAQTRPYQVGFTSGGVGDMTYAYDAGANRGVLRVGVSPQSVSFNSIFLAGSMGTTSVLAGRLSLTVVIDGSGQLLGPFSATDLRLTATTVAGQPALTSPLLTGRVARFANFVAGPADTVDIYFEVTGGSLLPLYAGRLIHVSLTLENPTPAHGAGPLMASFSAKPKGSLRPEELCGGEIGDYVWHDRNRNGLQDDGLLSEVGLSGVAVQLRTEAGAPLLTAATRSTPRGEYRFVDLCPGTYQVTLSGPGVPAGFTAATPVSAGDETRPDDSNAPLPFFVTIPHATLGPQNPTIDFGFVSACTGEVGDLVWLDANQDGLQTPGESGMGGVTVELMDAATDAVLKTMTTDSGGAPGRYVFTGVCPGSYYVRYARPDGYQFTIANDPDAPPQANDSDAAGWVSGTEFWRSASFELGEAQKDTTWDAGLVALPTIDIRKEAEGPDTRTVPRGSEVTFQVVVTNTSAEVLTDVEVTDALVPSCSAFFLSLAPGASAAFTCAAPNVTLGFTNEACVTALGQSAIAGDCDTSSVRIGAIDVRKQAEGPDSRTVASGSNVPFLIVVTNTGEVDLRDVRVGDALVPGCERAIGSLAPGARAEYTCTAASVNAGFTNEACTTGEADGVVVSDCDTSSVLLLASLGDRLWQDANANGLQDLGEPGIEGAWVELRTCDGGLLTRMQTGPNGVYRFTGLQPGSYSVRFSNPDTAMYTAFTTRWAAGEDLTVTINADSNVFPTTAEAGCVTLAPGDDNVTIDAGLILNAPGFSLEKTATPTIAAPYQPVTYTYTATNTGGLTLTGVVIRDDNGTPGYAADDFTVCTIPSLPPGRSETCSAQIIPVVSTETTVNGLTIDAGAVLVATNLPNGDLRVTYVQDFGINDNTYGTGAIGWGLAGGHKFGDLTGSDKLEFRFHDKAGNVVLDFYQDYITSTTNKAVYPSGYASLCASGGDGSMVAGSASNIVSCTTSMADNLNRPGNLANKAALILNSPTSLRAGGSAINPADVVIDSAKAPGGWDPVNRYTVVIKGSTFGPLGLANFGGVSVPDQHNSPNKLNGPHGFVTTPKDSTVENTATGTAEVTVNGTPTTVTATDTAKVAIVAQPASLSGYVYVDANNDGLFQAGESVIPGTTVTLTGADSLGPVQATTTTDGNGFYRFSTLLPGTYTISETQPAHLDGKDAVGSLGGVAHNDVFTNITVRPGAHGINNNFGELMPASISGCVYYDLNNNGVRDVGEAGIATTLTLSGIDHAGNAVSRTATSDAGTCGYSFSHLVPGTYTVMEAQPAAYIDGKDALGEVDAVTTGALSNDTASGIVLPPGAAGVNYNFGEITAAVPNLALTKTADRTVIEPFQRVTYTYVVTNTSTAALPGVWVKDDNGTPGYLADDFAVCGPFDLAGGASTTCTATIVPVVSTGATANGSAVRAGQVIVTTLGNGNIKATYLQNFGVNDNTYGTGAIGWPSGHKFGDLTGSDKLEFRFFNGAGTKVLDFYVDTITQAAGSVAGTTPVYSYPAGYGTLGPYGGDGSWVSGTKGHLLGYSTSITENLNHPLNVPKKAGLIVNSPTSGTPGSVVVDMTAAPGGWNSINTYTVVIDRAAFGASGFGSVEIPDQHNSPSKLGVNQIVATPASSTVTNLATATSGTLTAIASASVDVVKGSSGASACALTTATPTPFTYSKQLRWNITNGGGAPVTLQNVLIVWPASNGYLSKVKLDGDNAWDGTISCAGGTCIANITETMFVADENKKGIKAGDTRLFALEFQSNASAELAQYSLVVDFGAGCVASYNAGPKVCGESQAIGDFVWFDANNNGIQDGPELGVPGVSVSLKALNGAVLGTAVTDANGRYLFDGTNSPNVCAGTRYVVEMTPPAGYSTAASAAPGSTSATDSNLNPAIVTVASGGDQTVDFGLIDGINYCPSVPLAGVTTVGTLWVTPLVAGSPAPEGTPFAGRTFGKDAVIVRYDQSFAVNDNTYGTGSSWGHTFGDLVGSDMGQFAVYNATGSKTLEFKIDTISASAAAPSGYASLGVLGGEGGIVSGTSALVLAATTAIDANLNSGYCAGGSTGTCKTGTAPLLMNSGPAPNATYSSTPDFRLVNAFYAVVDAAAFGASGLAGLSDPASQVRVVAQHNSPQKSGSFTPAVCR